MYIIFLIIIIFVSKCYSLVVGFIVVGISEQGLKNSKLYNH